MKHQSKQALFILLLLTALVSGCTGIPQGVEPVRPFDVQRYKGEWFEIMRLDHSFERGLTNVTATYTLRDDGSVGVINKGFDRNHCRWKEANGHAVFQGNRDTASLSVTFLWPFAGGYHVFALDQEDYAWAVVSGPSTDYLWILARRPDLGIEMAHPRYTRTMGAVEFVVRTANPLQLKNVLMQALSPLSAEQSSLIRGSASPNPSAIHPGEPGGEDAAYRFRHAVHAYRRRAYRRSADEQ